MKKKLNNKKKKGFACSGEPLFDKDDFLYYFESRLQSLIREEVDAHFRQCFWNLPF